MGTAVARHNLLAELRVGIARLVTSEAWIEWLKVQRRFHHYSYANTLLILAQRPDATRVAGYGAWRQLGRQVRKGEHAIAILAPLATRSSAVDSLETQPPAVSGFTVAHVFDIVQTQGVALPQILLPLEGQEPDAGFDRMELVARSLGYQVARANTGNAFGDCDPVRHSIRVRPDLSDAQALKTLTHEVAHGLLHANMDVPREIAELEAESVAYVVCGELGLDTSAYSFGYVTVWAGGGEAALAALATSAQRIQKAAVRILERVQERGRAL